VLSHSLAFKVVGALPDLVKDEVPAQKIHIIQQQIENRANKFIENAEMARETVKSDWPGEARLMRGRGGSIYELAMEYLVLVVWVMEEAGIDAVD
jgi:hypothetical protein